MQTMAAIKEKVSDALRLDNTGRDLEAYRKYLESVSLIVSTLSRESVTGMAVNMESVKVAKLGQQCMDRISELATQLYSTRQESFSSLPPSPSQVSSSCELDYRSLPSVPVDNPTNPRPHTSTNIQVTKRVSKPPVTSRQDSFDDPGPLEIAKRQNQALMTAYKNRMEALGTNKALATNLSLNLQRRLAENLSVAKAKEESLARKIRERHRRMTEEAARSIQSTMGMSRDELERRQLFMDVLNFEQNSTHLLSWREKLKAKRNSSRVIESLIKHIISLGKHPVTQLLYKYQYATYDKLQPLLEKYSRKQTPPCDSRTNQPARNSLTLSGENASEPRDCLQIDRQSLHSQTSMDTASSVATTSDIGSTLTTQHSVVSTTSSVSSNHSETIIEETTTCVEGSRSDLLAGTDLDAFEVLKQEAVDVDCISLEKLEAEALKTPQLFPRACIYLDLLLDLTCSPLIMQRHLDNIVQDVHQFLEKLQTMFVVAYGDLDTAMGRDICYACIEEPFFRPVWPYILALFRLVHRGKEDELMNSMAAHVHCFPKDLGVPAGLQLSAPVPTRHAYAYEPAVNELRLLVGLVSPLTKLECVVRVSKLICRCVEDHYESLGQSEAPSIGADDLLPVLVYTLVRSQLPQLYSECQALEEFIHEGYLMGEEGYCLTSLQTAMNYVITLVNQSNNGVKTLNES